MIHALLPLGNLVWMEELSLGPKLALNVVFLTKQIGALRPASGTVLKQCKAPRNMIQLCWKNASPRCAEAVGLAAKPLLLCSLGAIMAPVRTESPGQYQKSDSCDEFLSRDIKLAPISVQCLTVVQGRGACVEEFSATQAGSVEETTTSLGPAMCAA